QAAARKRAEFSSSHHLHSRDRVFLHDAIDDVHSGDDASEYRIAAIEMRLWRVCNEELTAARVGPGECHAQSASLVAKQVDLIADRVAGSAAAVATWISVLDDEIRHDTMPARTGIIAALDQRDEVVDG